MRKIAVANAKGGVGKTSLVANLAAALALIGHRKVLVIDFDSSAAATFYLLPTSPGWTLTDALERTVLFREIIVQTVIDGLEIAPGGLGLTKYDRQPGRAAELIPRLFSEIPRRFDYVLTDTAPAWSAVTVEAIAASREILIPLDVNGMALVGFSNLLELIAELRTKIAGVVPMRADRTRMTKLVLETLEETLPGKILPAIRQTCRVPEAATRHVPVHLYMASHPVVEDFNDLARAIMAQHKGRKQSWRAEQIARP